MIYLELTPDESAAAFVAIGLVATTPFKGKAKVEQAKILPKLQSVLLKIEASQKASGILRDATKKHVKEISDGESKIG